jgi:hypothetical protein
MTESAKTITTTAVAAALLLVAFIIRPKPPYSPPEGEVGQLVFSEWKDPTAAKSMQITTFDETRQATNEFKVALVDGKWVVPSHANYPAKAEDHVMKAASDLINLKILEVVSNIPGDHETYGVVEPDPAKLKNPATGVGKLVVVKDKDNRDLSRLIIGKEDKAPSASSGTSLRFVRRAGQDRVYRVALSTDLFTSKFQDWIDPDLLGIKAHWDITEMKVRDYTLADNDGRIAVARKNDFDLQYNDQKAAWTARQITDYKDDKPVESKLAADEEVDATKLNDAKTALSGLKIVDIYRKPSALADKLKKAKDSVSDADARRTFGQFGFYAPPSGKGDVFGAGGDMTVSMKDGVEYTVRFGGADLTLKEKEEGKKSDKASAGKRTEAQRIVFVTTRFNEDLIPKPKLEPLPEAKKSDAPKAGEQKPGEQKPGDKQPETKGPAGNPPEAKTPADTKTTPASPDKTPASGPKAPAKGSAAVSRPDLTLAMADAADLTPPKADAAKAGASVNKAATLAAAGDKKSAQQRSADQKAAAKPSDTKPADANKTAPEGKVEPKANTDAGKPASDIKRADEEKAADAERKRIEAENKQKTDEYEASIKKGKERAKQLNDRFADWFYLISDDDYKKVHVARNELIKKKAAAPDSTGLPPVPTDPFNKK